MKKLIRKLYKWRYGVRGGLRPPIGPGHNNSLLSRILYRWKRRMWKMENSIYTWTDLPEFWAFRMSVQSWKKKGFK